MTNTNIISDVCALTGAPQKVITKLVDAELLCIGNAIKEATLDHLETITLNIGIGTLSVNLLDMQCKFVPNNDLKSIIRQCLSSNSKINPLEFRLEQEIIDKLLKIYDEVI